MATESFFSSASLAYLASAGAGKDGKAYSIKPTDGTGDFTFSRGSNLAATRVGPTGLIEKGRENLILQSNQFDTTWIEGGTATLTSGQNGYDGTNNAWLLEAISASFIFYQSVSSSGVCTFSVYAKAGTTDKMVFYVVTSPSTRAGFDLSSGTIDFTLRDIDASIEAVGATGWYRCSITFEGASTSVRILPTDNTLSPAIGDNIYIQDAQLEIGLAATDYIESGATTGKAGLLEDEPRFDYSGGATCPSLLLEPSRTNLVPQSEYLNDTIVWSGASAFTIEDNSTASPEGVVNAAKLTPTTSTGNKAIYYQTSVTIGTDYTHSFFIKPNGYDYCSIDFSSAFGAFAGNYVIFDLTGSGSIDSNTANLTASIEPLSNGWFKVSATDTAVATSSTRIYLRISPTSSIANYAGNGTDGAYFWGAQLEAGSYPTSYIPNHSGGTITRGADDCSVTGISSLFGQTEGTLFLELEPMTLNDNPFIALYANSSNYLEVNIGAVAGTQYEMRLSDGTNSTNPRGGTPQANTTFKLAIKVESGNQKTFVDGTEIISSSIALDYSSTPLSILAFNRSNGNNHFYGNVKQTLVFPEALSDADCITLTT